MRRIQICVVLLGLVCIGVGIFRNEVQEVMQKAILVCLECIGLG